LPLIAADSGRPKISDIVKIAVRHLHDTANWPQSFVATKCMPATISDYWLDSRERDWLHCLRRLKSVINLVTCHKPMHMLNDARCLWQIAGQASVLYKSLLDFVFFAPFLNQSAWEASRVENRGKMSHFLTSLKNRGELVEMSVRIIRATHRF